MAHMDKPETVEAFKYNGKTFETFQAALEEEFYDKVNALVKANGSSEYFGYCKEPFKKSMKEIVELCQDIQAYGTGEVPHPEFGRAPVHAGFEW